MKAMVLSAYGRLELTEMPAPEPGVGEVLVHVEACGICGSDVHGMDGSTGRRIPPIVMGHEAAGTIAAVGAGVTAYAVGERVTFDSTIYCSTCEFCQRGEINLCNNREIIGVSCDEFRRHGAFAEFVALPERVLYRLPADFEFSDAAMLEAVSVGLHGVKVLELAGRETVLVIGAGMIGLLALQAAKALGAGRTICADVDATRLEMAKRMGADEAVCASGDALVAAVRELTAGRGVDAVIEAVGHAKTILAAIDAVRKGGRISLVGNLAQELPLPLQKIVVRQIRLQGSCASSGEYPLAIELIAAGKIQVKPLITAIAPLEEGPAWFERLYNHEPNLMKVILSPTMKVAR
jgi:L-iditol 2-dehydrogenase